MNPRCAVKPFVTRKITRALARIQPRTSELPSTSAT